MQSSQVPILKRTKRLFKSLDMYAAPVTLTYNQQRDFPTMTGAILTIISAVVLTYYFSANTIEYVAHQRYSHTTAITTFT